MEHTKFIGRKSELAELESLVRRKTASLVVIKGRRRIGKSRLITEFCKGKKAVRFVGLAPNRKTTAQSQRDHFAHQIQQQTGLPEIRTDDWSKLFLLLYERVKKGNAVIVLDEITWMGSKDPDFLGKLHFAWETLYKTNPKLILIICGSVSAWIEKNILSSTGYFGRVTLKMTLDELPLNYCNQLLSRLGFEHSSYEKLLLLAVVGGVPWYLEQVDPHLSAIDNIKKLCFKKEGLLVEEFDRIFHDLFLEKRSDVYLKIVDFLSKGSADYRSISKGIDYPSSGALSEILGELILSGFIQRDFTWKIKTGMDSQMSYYRLRDNYLRFYLKYIRSRLNQIDKNRLSDITLEILPGWNTVLGLQFENLVLNNRNLILNALNIDPNVVVNDNPFFQSKTTKQQGCQIDYLIQTKYNTLFVCEIKFGLSALSAKIVREVKEKISRMSIPKNYTCVPVLIHVNDISQSIIDQDYFVHSIDICNILDKTEY